MIRRLISATVLASGLWVTSVHAAPAVLSVITNQGGKIVDTFDAPAGMSGYVVDFRGRALTVYVTRDGEYLLTGAMLDANGKDYGSEALNAYIDGPQSEKNWDMLASTNWVADGDDDADQIVYTFTDANCPYCKKFWQQARPWVEAGRVQLRHIMVGIIKQDSPGKAAAILAADDASQHLHGHLAGTATPPLAPLSPVPKQIQTQLKTNHEAMVQMGVNATPAMFYKNADGGLEKHMGLAGDAKLVEMFGPRPEEF